MTSETVSALELTLKGERVGYVAGYSGGKNVFTLAPEFLQNDARHPLTLSHTNTASLAWQLARKHPCIRSHKLHPVLSNLLPEGALRAFLSQAMKIHQDNEYPLLGWLDRDPPGALVAVPMEASAIPPLNEYTAMTLAALAGVETPEIKLIALSDIEALPTINLPDEKYAYGIRRYDRLPGNERVHSEDFAQILFAYAHEKYRAASYEQIGKLIYQNTVRGQRDAVQMAVRLLINILLANGDAHLKNWSVIYPDRRNAQLSPADDIVVTRAYMKDETQYAFNMSKTKNWYDTSFEHFRRWPEYGDIPWRPVLNPLKSTMDKARTLWPDALNDSVMPESQQVILRAHWRQLHPDFRII